MSTQELERLDVKLGQEVLYYHYHNKTVNADTLDELREIREEIMEEESSYFTAISQRVWTDYDKKEKELSGEVEVSEGKKSLEEINGISEPIPATNFRITDDELGQGTAKEKFRANIMAIQLLKKCEDENRNATPEEQEILSRIFAISMARVLLSILFSIKVSSLVCYCPAAWPSVVVAPATSVSPLRMASSDSLSSCPTNWTLALVEAVPWGQLLVTRFISSALTGPV